MTANIDIKEVIRESSSDVALSALAKKGFKKVRVLNKDTINELIARAVAKVVDEQTDMLDEEERQKILAKSRAEFDGLMNKHQKTSGKLEEYQEKLNSYQERIAEYQEKITEYETQNCELRQSLVEYEAKNRELQESLDEHQQLAEAAQSAGSNKDLQALADSIEKLGRKIASGGGGSSASVSEDESELAIKAMLSNVSDVASVESNIVEVTEKKATGVGSVLDKLKNLNKGGD